MRIIVGVDDTDNKDSEKGTGRLVSSFIKELNYNPNGSCEGVVRHQLYVHPTIPYTSHNSAMSFTAELGENEHQYFLDRLIHYLKENSASDSEPGVCFAVADKILNTKVLIDYGNLAKKSVLNTEYAYETAARANVYLTKIGKKGEQGVIGALGAVGLRLNGNDGRFRGKYEHNSEISAITAGELRRKDFVSRVQSIEGELIADDTLIELEGKVKSVLLYGQKVLLVVPGSNNGSTRWKNCPMDYIRKHH